MKIIMIKTITIKNYTQPRKEPKPILSLKKREKQKNPGMIIFLKEEQDFSFFFVSLDEQKRNQRTI